MTDEERFIEGPPARATMKEKDKYWQEKLEGGWDNARTLLERPEKPVETFSGSGSYPTTREGVERISELLIESMEEGLKTNPNSTGKWKYEYTQY